MENKVVTIQQTAKTWKGLWLITKIGQWVSILWAIQCFYNLSSYDHSMAHNPFFWLMIAIIFWLASKVAKGFAWWNHG